MKTYTYKGSTKENHMEIVTLGWQFGLQNIRKTTMGEKIAELANDGNERAQQVCESHPEFFDVTEKRHNAIFFDDLKEEAQKRIIEDEMLETLGSEEPIIVSITVDSDTYGYDEDPKKQTLEQHIHALIIIDGEEHSWLMVWNCYDHEFNTIMREDQK